MNNHEIVYLKMKRGKTNPQLEHVKDTSTSLPMGKYSPKQAADEIKSYLDYWRTTIGDITEIEIKDYRSNLSAKSSIPEDYILTVEALVEKIKDLRLEIFEEFNGYIEL